MDGFRLIKTAAVTAIAGAAGGATLLAAEAVLARARRYAKPDLHLAMRSSIGSPDAPPLRLVLLGDSTALGVGAEHLAQTVGGRLGHLLAERSTKRRVELSSVAVSGSRAADLDTQVSRALVGAHPDVAVIMIGSSDALRPTRSTDAAEYLAMAVRRLRAAEVPVVVGTCPDLGAVRAFAPPLRQILGWRGRRLARAQLAAVRAVGGVPVDLARRTGAVFRADAGTYCHDKYHPSADGYRLWAHALLPAVTEAMAVPRA